MMGWIRRAVGTVFAAIAMAVAFLFMRGHDRRQGAKENDRQREQEDRENADRISVDVSFARRDFDLGDDIDRKLRELGGIRDDDDRRP